MVEGLGSFSFLINYRNLKHYSLLYHILREETQMNDFIKARIKEGNSIQNIWDIAKRDNPDFFIRHLRGYDGRR